MARETLEKIIQELKKLKNVAIVGLSKNVGKTTVVNFLLRRLEGACVMTVGRDGEEEDKLFKNPKPAVVVPEGSYAFVPAQIPVNGAEVLETFESPSGKNALIKALVELRVQTVRIGSLDEIAEILNKIEGKVGTVLIDGAFDRMGAVGISEAVVLVTGVQIGKNVPDIVTKTFEAVKRILTPLAPAELLEAFRDGKREVLTFEKGVTRSTGIIGVAGNEEKIIEACTNAKSVYLPGAVTEGLAQRLKIPIVVPTCDKIFAKKGSFFVMRKPKLIGVAVNHTSLRSDVKPSFLVEELRKTLNGGIIVFDVLFNS